MAKRICTEPDCDNTYLAVGYCNMHYRRWKRYGDPSITLRPQSCVGDVCSEPDCEEPIKAKGLCSMHYNLARYQADPDKARARSRDYREIDPDKFRADRRTAYKANPEKILAQMRQWKKANPDKVLARGRAAYKANHKKILAMALVRREADPEKYRKAAREWGRANPDKRRAMNHNSSRGRRGAGGDGLSALQWRALVEATSGRCVYCGERPKKWHLDHIIPLKPKNGDPQGQHTFNNVIPACPPCNRHKHNSTLAEWRGRGDIMALRATIRRVHRLARALLKARQAA